MVERDPIPATGTSSRVSAEASSGTVASMPRFKVTVTSESAVEVGQALHGRGIPTIGPAMAGFTSAPGSWTVSDHLTAVLDAENAEAAVQRGDGWRC
jgi:hypothetical protein